ncbi:response regulator [Novosphingobium album (ex Liu et al. 2023)]|uniref:Response regulator transcription factor n=1 Tax=Novosphingobium album (ex Liu et al. 2023) TaxID=3031130 RepID=A0ABT5WQE4_9SPHN|nr:response regulator transcription factor [Novosphingobium album (ex Liu et al. 2023)]MDE8651208.1 response regulator transcription factor [Novosphingobium album (ex Liu et al. 2023)]
MRIMIVEDDRRLARGMEVLLNAAGFVVDILSSGEEALQIAESVPYSAIVLDLGLPDLDGLEVLQRLRRRSVNTPILISTARDSLADRVNGLDQGADDYLAKPFHLRELESRVRALARRGQGTPDPVLKIGELTFDRLSRTAYLNDTAIELRRRELAVLETLLNRPGKVVTKERLAAEVFNFNDAVAPNALEVYVARLRRKLLPNGPVIRTIRGLGYMIDAK